MTSKRLFGAAYVCIAAVAAMIVIQGCGTALNADTYVGNWTGTWTNTTFGSTGAARVVVTKDSARAAGDLHFNVDLDGSVFGGSNPSPENLGATVAEDVATLTATTSNTYGTLSGTLEGDGTISGGGTDVAGQVKSYTVTGTWSATAIDADVVISFDDGSADATAKLALTKQ
jgi:hypothetical protein